jgi:hypothetical protein
MLFNLTAGCKQWLAHHIPLGKVVEKQRCGGPTRRAKKR